MHALLILVLQIFGNERFRGIVVDTLNIFVERLLKSESKKRKKRKKKKMTDQNHVDQIQSHLRARVNNPEAHILEQAGVIAEINLEEGGLNEAEGSFAGITPTAWDEYREQNPTIAIENPAEFENLSPEVAASHITHFSLWYFQKPPKQDFFSLPSLLWLVACDAAYLAPAPVISRIQKLVGDAKPDGIWGSGTTKLVTEFFSGKTVPDMVQFASDLTDLLLIRYEEMKQYPQHAANAVHWIERAERKIKMLMDFVNRQNQLADQGETAKANVEQVTRDDIIENAGLPATPNPTPPVEEAPTEAAPPAEEFKPETVVVPAEDLKVLTAQIELNTQNFQELAQVVVSQSDAIVAFKEALAEYTEMQKQMLEQLTKSKEASPNDEGSSPGKPKTHREELNMFPDSLLQ